MIHILKATGEVEPFSEDKLTHSIRRAGIPQSLQPLVVNHVKQKLFDNITSAEIYHHISEFLSESPQPFARARYSLKQAIMELGPTGYPFEDYIAKILTLQGYQTQTRQIVRGKCVTHEIDIIARKNTVLPSKIMVEAKFHNTVGLRTNIHVPLYTKARYDDIKENQRFTQAMIITNTKATIDAIAYCACVDMKIVSWSYPEGDSLRDWVEKFFVFPVTSITTLSTIQKQQLMAKGIVLCKDICSDHSLLKHLELSDSKAQEVIKEIEFICHVG